MATPKEFGAGSVNSHRRAKRVAQGMPAGRAGVSPVRRGGVQAQVDQADPGTFTPRWSKFPNTATQTHADSVGIGFFGTRIDHGDMTSVTYSAGTFNLNETGLYVIEALFVATTTPNGGGVESSTFAGTIPPLFGAFVQTNTSIWRASITAVVPVDTFDSITFTFVTSSASSTTFASITQATVSRVA